MPNDREIEKHEEKEEKEGEDRGGEKWSSDRLGSFIWALILIWAGVVFLARNLGEDGEVFLTPKGEDVWAWILAGAGVLLWFEVLLRVAMPAYRRPLGGRIIFATVLIVIGVGGIINVSLWPLIIVAIGVSMLLGYFAGPKGY
jgi:hypothetical protein